MLVGHELIEETIEKIELIKKKLKVPLDWLKTSTDLEGGQIELEVGNHVFLKISPITGTMRLDEFNKLSSVRYVKPFEILRRVGEVA